MKTKIGILGEELAVKYLRSKGYSIITTHFCVRGGEIDIIAHKSKNLTFIEVKTRSIQSKGKPYEAFTKTKFIRIKRTIHNFLSQYTHTYDNFQIDLVCIEYEYNMNNCKITHYKNISLEDLK